MTTMGSKGGVLKLCLAAEGQYQLHLQLVRDMKSDRRGAMTMLAARRSQRQQGRQPSDGFLGKDCSTKPFYFFPSVLAGEIFA